MLHPLDGWRRCALALVACLGVAAAHAEPDPPVTDISLREALAKTLEHNPRLAAYPWRIRAADAGLIQAGLRPQPNLSLEAERLAGDPPAEGVEGAELTLALSQMIELGGKRAARMEVARLALDTARLDYEQARLDVLGEAVNRYVALVAAEEKVELAGRAVKLSREAEAAAERRVVAGAAPDSELKRLGLATRQARIAVQRAEVLRQRAIRELAAMWAETSVGTLRTSGGLRPLPPLPAFETVASRLEDAPQLLRVATEARQREAEFRLAKANGRRDITFSVGARHDRLGDENTLVAGLSVPLNFRNPNRGNIAGARAEMAAAEAELEARRVELMAMLEATYRELELLRDELDLIENSALPLARNLYQDIQQGYRAGRYSLLELINARQEQLALEQRAIDVAAHFRLQRNELERLTGQDFSMSGEKEAAK